MNRIKILPLILILILALLPSCGEEICFIPVPIYTGTDMEEFLLRWMETDNYREQTTLYNTKEVEFPIPKLMIEGFRLNHIEVQDSMIFFEYVPIDAPKQAGAITERLLIQIPTDGETFDEIVKKNDMVTERGCAQRNDKKYIWYMRNSDGRYIKIDFESDIFHVTSSEDISQYVTFVDIKTILGE